MNSPPAGPARLIIATRQSPLALAQVEEVRPLLHTAFPQATLEVRKMQTPGDRDLVTALTDPSVPPDYFTRDLDCDLLEGRADLAVHSAKDLPQTPVPGLSVVALLPARDIREALVARKGMAPSAIRTIGTSSPRREAELRRLLPAAAMKPLRGTIEQRMAKLDAGEYDALVVAACALERLGLADRITAYLPFDSVPQQGRLALVVRADRAELIQALQPWDVRQRAGMVALVGGAGPLDDRAGTYLREADVILTEVAVSPDLLGGHQARVVTVDPNVPHELHATLLHEVEQGALVVRLYGGAAPPQGDRTFLTAWQIRHEILPGGTVCPSVFPSYTLFTGTEPGHFHRYGPLLPWPMIELAACPLEARCAQLARELPASDGVIFPSRFAVRSFLEALPSVGGPGALAGKKLLAVGPATERALLEHGLRVEAAADHLGGVRELIRKLGGFRGGRYLYPCSDASPQAERISAWRETGIELVPAVHYTNRETMRRELPAQPFDRVLFTSPSTVRAYFRRYPEERASNRIWMAIGPSTRSSLHEFGLPAVELSSWPG